MNLERLTTFLHVYRTGSMTAAARLLARAQPSVSYQIKALERELGIPLFERRGPRLIATPQAAVLADKAIPLVTAFREMTATLGQLTQVKTGTLRAVSSHSVTTSLLWRAVSRFRREHPGVLLTIANASSEQVARSVRDGQADIGITSIFVRDDVLECHPLLEYDYWRVGPTRRTSSGYILPARGSSLRHRIEAALGSGARIVAEIASLEVVPQLVRDGVGVAILPRFALPAKRKGLRLKKLPELGKDSVCSVSSRAELRHPAAPRFEAIIQRTLL